MAAEIKPVYDINRMNLRDVIPISGPLSVLIEPTRICNMKCFYCMHATRGEPQGALAKSGFKIAHMDMGLYDKIVDEIMKFNDQPKRVTFTGLGEPLTNPRLGEMARRLRKAGFSGRNDIVTNAVALTPALADELVDSGINRIQISVQGLTSEANKKFAGVPVNMERYIENITYLYNNRKNTKIYIKIIDSNLKDEAEKKLFFKMFSSICDTIFVEHLIVLEQAMGDHGGKTDSAVNLTNEPYKLREVCNVMFYILQLNIDGDSFPCPIPGAPTSFTMGNVNENSLQAIWNGEVHNQMLRENLINGYNTFPECAGCECVVCVTDPAEWLDDCREEVLARLPK